MSTNNQPSYFAGIDIGTSGVRCTVIDSDRNIVEVSRVDYSRLDNAVSMDWWECVVACLSELSASARARLNALSIDGTSGTVVLTDHEGKPLTIPLMYNDARASKQAARIAKFAPEISAANGVNTSLARVLWLLEEYGLSLQDCFIVHQADFVIGQLTGLFNRSDENNVLKLGYDSRTETWPSWLSPLGLDVALLPTVNKPGDFIATVSEDVAKSLGLHSQLSILAGTTDSIAAFNATAVTKAGVGVTSLGSTLVVKMIADNPIVDTQRGVYSHRFNHQWLVGGASNCGAKILRDYFTDSELCRLSDFIDPNARVDYGYYPLSGKGERFPLLNPEKRAVLEPRPDEDHLFLHGLLEALADIEKIAYETLYERGVPKLQKILTVGGGAKNPQWMAMRENIIGVPIAKAKNSEASFGMALLSLRHHNNEKERIFYAFH